MSRTMMVGISILIVGLLGSLGLALWAGPSQAVRTKSGMARLQDQAASLLRELRQLPTGATSQDLSSAKELVARAQSSSSMTARQLSSVQAQLQRVPEGIGGGLFHGGVHWNKEGVLNQLDALQRQVAEIQDLTVEMSNDVQRASFSLLSLNDRVTDIESSVNATLKQMDVQVNDLSGPEKVLANVWLPILLALVTVAGGISTIWLGWRQDRRAADELRLKATASGRP